MRLGGSLIIRLRRANIGTNQGIVAITEQADLVLSYLGKAQKRKPATTDRFQKSFERLSTYQKEGAHWHPQKIHEIIIALFVELQSFAVIRLL